MGPTHPARRRIALAGAVALMGGALAASERDGRAKDREIHDLREALCEAKMATAVLAAEVDGLKSGAGGLTTAATIWYAAALGVAAGTGLCFLVALSTALATLVLRVPRRLVLRGRPGRLPRLASLPSEDADEDSDMAEMAS